MRSRLAVLARVETALDPGKPQVITVVVAHRWVPRWLVFRTARDWFQGDPERLHPSHVATRPMASGWVEWTITWTRTPEQTGGGNG